MKKLLLFGLGMAAITAGTMSLFNSETEFTKYHSDIDGVNGPNFTANPPVGKTGAPFDGNCTDCHSGSVNPAAGTVDFTVSGLGTGYYLNETYPVTISSVSGTKNGFQMVVVDEAEAQAGALTAGTNSNTIESGGRQYIRHSNSTGANAYTFDWTSPSTDVGDITFYYTYNISGAPSTSAGDAIYVGELTISPAGDVSVNEYDALKEAYSVRYDYLQNQVVTNFTNPDYNRILFHVQDLSGRVVSRIDLGKRAPGNYQETFMLDNADANGIYLVSVFLGNRVLTKKMVVAK